MIIKSMKVKCKGKTEEKGISKTKGTEYTNKSVFFEDGEGILIQMKFCNDLVFNKAVENKEYILKFYLAPNGNISLNDIEG